MKRICESIIFSALIFFSACSMGGNVMDRDRKIANERMESLLEAIQDKDRNTLQGLFSKTAITQAKNFESQVMRLFDYYQGEVLSYDDWGGPGVSDEIENGDRKKSMDLSCDVVTNVREYRFLFLDITVDDYNPDNVGIWSLYVIKKEDDTDPQMGYGGDGKYTPGINIGIKNIYVD